MGDQSAQIDEQPERRTAKRIALRLSATVREAGRSRIAVRIIDMSTHGCRLEMPSSALSEPWVWLNIAGLDTQYSRVVWHGSEFAGLEFAAPLDQAVFDNLLALQNRISETSIGELRAISVRATRLASEDLNASQSRALAALSRDCVLQAVIHAFQLGNAAPEATEPSQLTSVMIRTTVQA